MTTTDVTHEFLGQSAREIAPQVEMVRDVGLLSELGKAERAGQNRAGVLNLIQNRIGLLMMEQSSYSDPAERAIGEVQGDLEVKRENLLTMGDNASLHAEGSAITSGTVESRSPRKVVAYFPTEFGFSLPRAIPITSLAAALAGGAKRFCPDCGQANCCVDARTLGFNGDYNGCSGRAKVAFMRCDIPGCTRRIYDLEKTVEDSDTGDPNEIVVERKRTPRERIEARLNIHKLAKHPQEAIAQGLRAATEPVQPAGTVVA